MLKPNVFDKLSAWEPIANECVFRMFDFSYTFLNISCLSCFFYFISFVYKLKLSHLASSFGLKRLSVDTFLVLIRILLGPFLLALAAPPLDFDE